MCSDPVTGEPPLVIKGNVTRWSTDSFASHCNGIKHGALCVKAGLAPLPKVLAARAASTSSSISRFFAPCLLASLSINSSGAPSPAGMEGS